MKTFTSIFAVFAPIALSLFFSSRAFAQQALLQVGPERSSGKAVVPQVDPLGDLTEAIISTTITDIKMFTNSNEKTFAVLTQDLGSYKVNTGLGTKRFISVAEAFKEKGVNMHFKPEKERDVFLNLVKIVIPKGETMKTSEILILLSRSNLRPATVCEALSLDFVTQKTLDQKLEVRVFGTLGSGGNGKTLFFGVKYSPVGSGPEQGASLEHYLRTDNLWFGSMIIPVIVDIPFIPGKRKP